MIHVPADFIVAVVVGSVIAIERYTPLLDRLKKKTPADAAGELDIADRTIVRLRLERNQAVEAAKRLEQTRSLEPILSQLASNAQLQSEVLDRLVHHNGSFKHIEESLGEMAEGLKLLTGFIAGVIDLSAKEPRK